MKWLLPLFVAVSIGIGGPLLELAFKCRDRISEGCVWGKAYLPLNMGLYFLLIGLPVAFAMHLLMRKRDRKRKEAAEAKATRPPDRC